MVRFVLLKLTTDRHKASRGLFATAELLVLFCTSSVVMCYQVELRGLTGPVKFDKHGMRSDFSLDILEVSLSRGLAKVSPLCSICAQLNPLECKCNCSATSNNMKLLYGTGRSWVGCYIWHSEEGNGWGRSPPCRPLFAVPIVTAHPSTASVPITELLYDSPLFCGFNMPI